MGKHRTRQQKIHAEQKRASAPISSSQPFTSYSFKPNVSTTIKANTSLNEASTTPLQHDLIKTVTVSAAIAVVELFLFFLLQNHLIVLPLIRY